MGGNGVAINHVAITLPNREAWLKQLAFAGQGHPIQTARAPRCDT